MSINRVEISGNLTRDPELRVTASGTNILTFSVAVNDRMKNNSTGEWEDYANFIECTMFGNRGEWLSRNLSKGSGVFIAGKLHYSSWDDKNGGGKRSKLEVWADDIELKNRPQQAQQQAAPVYTAPQAPQAPAKAAPAPAQAYDVYDEDIPF